MPTARRAVIDVGTNSVKLLVADVSGREVTPVWEEGRQTRLGQGFYETHLLQPGAIARTAAAVADFAAEARRRGAVSIRVIATSAARDAVNANDLLAAVGEASGLGVEILSGDQEAEWVFEGMGTDPALASPPVLLLDVGGGSTEFILGQGRRIHFRASLPLGTVRLMEKFPHSETPTPEELTACREWLRQFIEDEVRPVLDPAMAREMGLQRSAGEVQLVGTGGTAAILARMEAGLGEYDRGRIEATRLSLERVRWHRHRLWGLPLLRRQEIVGLPRDRADVILTGALIYEALMEQLGFAELRISTRGLRFAAVLESRARTSG
jgi:exopolyphosphatase/guanosine-5'-triphosphate,3'-diphosphate pyrophosphatase